MTAITRRVRRVTRETVFERGHRRIVVTLEPGDCIGFRLERTRRTYTASLSAVFGAVQRWNIDAQRRAFEKRVTALVKAGHDRRTAKRLAKEE